MKPQFVRYVLFVVGSLAVIAGVASAGSLPQGPPSTDPQYLAGLNRWRSPDQQNTACVFCHSPDGIEIAAYNFSDDNIRRRAEPHVGREGAELIVKFIHSVRQREHITKLLDPMTDRPLQPGGKVLAGNSAAERDAAFGEELKTTLPTLATGTVNSFESAQKAKAELLLADPRSLPIGIPLNRISEDAFHGKEHAILAHWISDEPLMLKFPWGSYFVLQNSYLDSPSMDTLDPLLQMAYHQHSKIYFAQNLSNDKFRALLLLSHIERLRSRGENFFAGKGSVALAYWPAKQLPNPLLELGLEADALSNSSFEELKFRPTVIAKKEMGTSEREQMRQMSLPSLYAGWLFDEGLSRSASCPPDLVVEKLSSHLLADGPYPLHAAFFVGKRFVVAGADPQAWASANVPQHYSLALGAFLKEGAPQKYVPKDSALYRKYLANTLLTVLYLYQHQLATTHDLYGEDVKSEVARIVPVISWAEPQLGSLGERLGKEILGAMPR